jgi:hypothetical protein
MSENRFKITDRFYPCRCESCGYIGSSGNFGTDYGPGDDTDVYCPECHSNKNDEIETNDYINAIVDFYGSENARLQAVQKTAVDEINTLRADCLKFIDKNNALQAQLDAAKKDNECLDAKLKASQMLSKGEQPDIILESAVLALAQCEAENIELKQELDAATLQLQGAREALDLWPRFDTTPDNSRSWSHAEWVDYLKKIHNSFAHIKALLLSALPTPAKAPDLTRIAACVKAAIKLDEHNDKVPTDFPNESYWGIQNDLEIALTRTVEDLTLEDHAWVERVGGV